VQNKSNDKEEVDEDEEDDDEDEDANNEGTSEQKNKRSRKGMTYIGGLTPIDQLFLFHFIIRTGVSQVVAATLFGISQATCSNIFNSWIVLLHQVLLDRIHYMPTVEECIQAIPVDWKFAGLDLVTQIVDAFEIPMEVPSDLIGQQASYSAYKV